MLYRPRPQEHIERPLVVVSVISIAPDLCESRAFGLYCCHRANDMSLPVTAMACHGSNFACRGHWAVCGNSFWSPQSVWVLLLSSG